MTDIKKLRKLAERCEYIPGQHFEPCFEVDMEFVNAANPPSPSSAIGRSFSSLTICRLRA